MIVYTLFYLGKLVQSGVRTDRPSSNRFAIYKVLYATDQRRHFDYVGLLEHMFSHSVLSYYDHRTGRAHLSVLLVKWPWGSVMFGTVE